MGSAAVALSIDTVNHPSVHQAPRRLAPKKGGVIRTQMSDILNNGVTTPFNSPRCSPVVSVGKDDRGVKFCVGYRKLNAVTKHDVYPLSRLEDAIDRLQRAE